MDVAFLRETGEYWDTDGTKTSGATEIRFFFAGEQEHNEAQTNEDQEEEEQSRWPATAVPSTTSEPTKNETHSVKNTNETRAGLRWTAR